MDAVNVVLCCREGREVEIQQFRVVVHAGACAQEDYNLGSCHFLVKEANEEADFFKSIVHSNVGVLQTLGDDIPLEFLWLNCRGIFYLGVDSLEAYLCEVPHAKKLEVFLLHPL